MMDKLKKLKEAYQACVDEMQVILDSAEDALSEDQQANFDKLKVKAENTKTQIANYEQLLKSKAETERLNNAPAPALDRQVETESVITEPEVKDKQITVPARAKRWSNSLRAFKSAEDAYTSGMWLNAVFGNSGAINWCNEHGVAVVEAVHEGHINTTGGYLVPDVLSNSIIELVKEYGVFRGQAGIVPMTSDKIDIPRRVGGLTAYFVGEGDAVTESTGSWDIVSLIAKDVGVLTRVSNDLASDAIVAIMDRITVEISRALATKEDACGFLGDGTSTYGGIVGVLPRLTTVAWSAPSVSSGAGLVEWSTGTGFENITLANLVSMMALLPTYARAGAKWHCSPTFYDSVITRLVTAIGGDMGHTLVDGVPQTRALGFPVALNNTMNTTGTDQKISLLFGDLSQAVSFGDRQQIEFAASDSASVGGESVFERNQRALRAIERFDINVHDVGTSSAAGPVVGLMCYDAS